MTDEKLWQAYLEGYKAGRNIEQLSEINIQTARTQFERWKEINDVID